MLRLERRQRQDGKLKGVRNDVCDETNENIGAGVEQHMWEGMQRIPGKPAGDAF